MKPDEIEQEIQDKGLTAPRVTPADIEANIAIWAIELIAVATAAATEPMRMSRCFTCMSSWAMTPSSSSRGIVRSKPCVAQTTAFFGPRPVANALGCWLGDTATRGIGIPARSANDLIMP